MGIKYYSYGHPDGIDIGDSLKDALLRVREELPRWCHLVTPDGMRIEMEEAMEMTRDEGRRVYLNVPENQILPELRRIRERKEKQRIIEEENKQRRLKAIEIMKKECRWHDVNDPMDWKRAISELDYQKKSGVLHDLTEGPNHYEIWINGKLTSYAPHSKSEAEDRIIEYIIEKYHL